MEFVKGIAIGAIGTSMKEGVADSFIGVVVFIVLVVRWAGRVVRLWWASAGEGDATSQRDDERPGAGEGRAPGLELSQFFGRLVISLAERVERSPGAEPASLRPVVVTVMGRTKPPPAPAPAVDVEAPAVEVGDPDPTPDPAPEATPDDALVEAAAKVVAAAAKKAAVKPVVDV
ncbi:hypothetical protein B0J18DRAFT_422761 [Chaetomium sp. MPI-SDFR-AT-0129]|nr:hypothetical protein B0J18DRAFT_422761 [Chaetomium sp. MPI-SDFR-AT-0129]